MKKLNDFIREHYDVGGIIMDRGVTCSSFDSSMPATLVQNINLTIFSKLDPCDIIYHTKAPTIEILKGDLIVALDALELR